MTVEQQNQSNTTFSKTVICDGVTSMVLVWYGIVVTRVCVSVCLSVRGRMPTLLHGPGCNLGSDIGDEP